MATVNYVKFYRGSKLAYQNIEKNADTLYFITDSNSERGELYLGDKLISSDISKFSELQDVLIDAVENKDFLVYNSENGKWENKSIYEAIQVMQGATATEQGDVGLVPAPGIGQQNYFLRGDGTWALPEGGSGAAESVGDNTSVQVTDGVISLKNFGSAYYKEDGSLVSGFKAGLEGRTIENDAGQIELAWFEPVTNSYEDLSASIEEIKENTYTKVEVDSLISGASHLKRVIVNKVEDIDVTAENADQYIYMVLRVDSNLNDKYDEYMVIDGVVEKVGSWEADLADYVKVADIAAERAKLATIEEGAQKNVINSVSGEFDIVDGQLSINSIDNSKVAGLGDSLAGFETRIEEVEDQLNYFVELEKQHGADIAELKDIVTWKDM